MRERGRDAEPAARSAEVCARLQRAFRAACAQHRVDGELRELGGRIEIAFAGQENADPGLMLQAFGAELAKTGVTADELCDPARLRGEVEIARAENALRHALARLRTLLIEHNSYLSGGLPWSFSSGPDVLRARGLAVYRFPARAAVDVTPCASGIRIAFAAADLGEVTSSGFYVPTRIRGDFCATLRYRVVRWEPGAASASFALFAQDEDSLLRWYVQRRSAGAGTPEVLGNFHNAQLTAPRAAGAREGVFRLARFGDRVAAAHRSIEPGDDWAELGAREGDPVRDVILGSKIWSSGACGALAAELTELTIDGEIPADQIPPVPIRPDPRRG